MIDADSDADLQLNGSPSARSPDKLSLPGGSRPESKNEMRESVDSGQERVDALLEAEEDYDWTKNLWITYRNNSEFLNGYLSN